MKKLLLILLIAVLTVVCLPLSSCGKEPTEYVTVKELRDASSGKLKELRESLSCFDEITEQYKDDDLVCILTDRVQGDAELFHSINNHPVVLLTAYPDACTEITSLDLSNFPYVDGVCHFDTVVTSLKEITIQNECHIYHSFNHCDGLKELTFSRLQSDICQSFNNCRALQSVTFGAVPDVIRDSFNDDPALQSVSVDREIDHAENAFQNTGDVEWTVRGKEYFDDELKELKDTSQNVALQKLADSKAIPQPEKSKNDELIPAFDDDGDMTFLDKDVRKKLYEKPDCKLTKFLLVNYPTITAAASGLTDEIINHKERVTEGEINYLVYQTCFISKMEKSNYIFVPAANRASSETPISLMSAVPTDESSVIPVADSDAKGVTLSTVSTFLYVIDIKTGEIIHIHFVGTDTPGAGDKTTEGKFLYEEAQEYLLTLL